MIQGNQRFSDVFWQYFLAAEMPVTKARRILEELTESRLDPIATLRTHSSLTLSEKEKLSAVQLKNFDKAIEQGAFIVSEDRYPEGLEEVFNVTPAFFAKGNESVLSIPKIAIVGTRRASTYGKAAAQKFAENFAARGLCVVSGGATGIDTAAHQGALGVDGTTIAVFGVAINEVFPASNGALFEQITKKGLIMSQFCVGGKHFDTRFLMRNRLVAALADAVIVIEAPIRSGALSTATAAAEMNKQVFVVPGNITNPGFAGSHQLVRDGAMLVDHPDQVLESLQYEIDFDSLELPASQATSEIHDLILEALAGESLPAEKIAELVGLNPNEILSELTMLELDGKVIRAGIGYTRC